MAFWTLLALWSLVLRSISNHHCGHWLHAGGRAAPIISSSALFTVSRGIPANLWVPLFHSPLNPLKHNDRTPPCVFFGTVFSSSLRFTRSSCEIYMFFHAQSRLFLRWVLWLTVFGPFFMPLEWVMVFL